MPSIRAFDYSPSNVGPKLKQVHVVFTDMNGSTQLWSEVLKLKADGQGDDTALCAAWKFVSELQTVILKVMLAPEFGGTFVKGMGDGLIVRFEEPDLALRAVEQAKTKVDNHARSFSDRFNYSGFRFVIHSTPDPVILGGYNLNPDFLGLKAVHEVSMGPDVPIRHPQSPDLFGHHINYAARCIGVVAGSAIYVTKDALEAFPESSSIQSDLEWPIVIGGLKGLGDSVKVQRLREQGTLDQEATLRAYKTKVLVYVPSADATEAEEKFKAASELMTRQMVKSSKSASNLVPHVFLACYTKEPLRWYPVPSDAETSQGVIDIADKRNEGADGAQLILRLEALDSEYLELLLLDEAAREIFKAGMAQDSEVVINTETRFIRTAKVGQEGLDPWQWANRGTELNASIYYLEMQPTDVNDIDLYARRIINGQSSFSGTNPDLQVIEVGRLWGKPSIYAIVQWRWDTDTNTAYKRMVELMRTPPISTESGYGNGGEFGLCPCGGGKTMPLRWRW